MFKIRYLLRDLYSYIFRYMPWVIIGFLLTFIIPGCEVKALTQLAMPWDATYPCDMNNSCYGPNTNSSFTTTYKGGLKYYSRDNLTTAKWSSITYYWNDAVFNNMDYAVVQFTYSLNNLIEQKEYSASVNGVTCQNSIYTPPVTNGSTTTSASITYECKHIPVSSKYNGYDIGITLLSEPINNFNYFWISTPVVYEDPEEIVIDKQDETNQKLDDLNDSITSSAVDTGALDDTHVNNDNGVLSAILTLPIDFFQSLINGLSGYNSCPNLNFNLPFIDYPVTLPCVRTLIDSLGATSFWESIGLLAGGLTMFYYLIHLGKELSDMMTLKETRAEWGGL